jgi:hypothetical protein
MTADDPLTRTRIDVAEMKGMLTQVLGDHGIRLANIETNHNNLTTQLHEKSVLQARQDERIKDLEDDSSGRLGRITGIIGSSVAILSAALSVYVLAR